MTGFSHQNFKKHVGSGERRRKESRERERVCVLIYEWQSSFSLLFVCDTHSSPISPLNLKSSFACICTCIQDTIRRTASCLLKTGLKKADKSKQTPLVVIFSFLLCYCYPTFFFREIMRIQEVCLSYCVYELKWQMVAKHRCLTMTIKLLISVIITAWYLFLQTPFSCMWKVLFSLLYTALSSLLNENVDLRFDRSQLWLMPLYQSKCAQALLFQDEHSRLYLTIDNIDIEWIIMSIFTTYRNTVNVWEHRNDLGHQMYAWDGTNIDPMCSRKRCCDRIIDLLVQLDELDTI